MLSWAPQQYYSDELKTAPEDQSAGRFECGLRSDLFTQGTVPDRQGLDQGHAVNRSKTLYLSTRSGALNSAAFFVLNQPTALH